MRASVLEDYQAEIEDVRPLKKACVTRWLSHGRACDRVVEKYTAIVNSCDIIWHDRADPTTQGIRNILFFKNVMLMILTLSDILKPCNVFCKMLQEERFQHVD